MRRTELIELLAGVPGWLTDDEAWALHEAVRTQPAHGRKLIAVELGSWQGRSTIAIASALRARGGGTVFAVDPHRDSALHHATGIADTFESLEINVRSAGLSDHVRAIRRVSTETAPGFARSTVDFLFVDGSHLYEDVAADLEAWGDALVDRAVVAFHDARDEPGVARFVEDRVATAGSGFYELRGVDNLLLTRLRRADRPRLLAVVARFKWVHIDYLAALDEHFDVFVAWSGEGGKDAPLTGVREGMRGTPVGWIPEDGSDHVRAELGKVIDDFRPDLVHVMYYNHEDLTLILRELAGDEMPIVFECRDPLTTLTGARPGDPRWLLERDAIAASDRQILISSAQRDYYERAHGLDLGDTSLVIPYAFRGSTVAPPSPKLSDGDGRTHIALVGTADDQPDHGRWYGEIIRRLVDLGFVVHSHFWDLPPEFGLSLEPYVELAAELDDYHHHATVPFRPGDELSALISRYDLMGVFHELEAAHHNESATLAVCLPTKSVCGWLHGGIPVVCFPHYRGVVERIDSHGIGFVIDSWDELCRIGRDRAAIRGATERCLDCRLEFSTEQTAERIAAFVAPLLAVERLH